MFKFLRENIACITSQKPGERFRAYHRLRKEKRDPVKAFMFIAGGCALIAVGIPLMVLPGPAIVFFALGLGLIASQLYVLALALDKTEVYLRKVLPADMVEEILKLIVVGAGVIIADFLLFFLLIDFTGAVAAQAAALFSALIPGFYLCKHWIFKQHKSSFPEVIRFAATCAAGGVLNVILLLLVLSNWPQAVLAAFVGSAIAASFMVYFLFKHWVFRRLRRGGQTG